MSTIKYFIWFSLIAPIIGLIKLKADYSSGLYIEKEAEALITNSHWKILRYVDINELVVYKDQNEQVLSKLNNTIKNNLKTQEVGNFFSTPLLPQLSTLKLLNSRSNTILNELIQLTPDEPERRKRYLINFLGTAIKYLTGNLDSEDGRIYEKEITELQGNSSAIKGLMKQQISIITNTMEAFNNSMNRFKINEDQLKSTQDKIITAIKHALIDQDHTNAQVESLNILEKLHESYFLLLEELDELIEAINFAKVNVLHPSVIKPETFLQQLQLIPNHLSKLQLPLKPTRENLPHFQDLARVSAYQMRGKIIFIIRVPLVTLNTYSYYHNYLLPSRTSTMFLFNILSHMHTYIAISDDNSQYFLPEKCEEIKKNLKLCDTTAVHSVNQDSPCEVQQILRTNHYETCTSNQAVIKINKNKLQKLQNGKWLLFVVEPTIILETCLNSPKTHLEANESMIILADPKCSLRINEMQLLGEENGGTSIINTSVPLPKQNYRCCENTLQKHLEKIKAVDLKRISLDSFNNVGHDLRDMKEKLEELEKPLIERHISKTIYTLIVLFMMTIVVIAFMLWRFLEPTRKNERSVHSNFMRRWLTPCNCITLDEESPAANPPDELEMKETPPTNIKDASKRKVEAIAKSSRPA